MEWGCMQALIDYDGWRKWKDFAAGEDGDTASKKASAAAAGTAAAAAAKAKSKKNRASMSGAT